jgi:hypothetical protein
MIIDFNIESNSMEKACVNCGIKMIEYDVYLLDEVYPDVIYHFEFHGFYCPKCLRMISNLKRNNHRGATGTYQQKRSGQAA